MSSRIRAGFAAGIVALAAGFMLLTSAVQAVNVAQGPVNPAPGGNTFTAQPQIPGDIGRGDGVVWTFAGFSPDSYDQMVWAPASSTAIKFAYDNNADAPGETLIFNEYASNLDAGMARWFGKAVMPTTDHTNPSFYTRLTIQALDVTSTDRLAFIRATALPTDDFNATLPPAVGDVGVVLPVPTDGFVLHLLFEASLDAVHWSPAVTLFDWSGSSDPAVAGIVATATPAFFYTPFGNDTDGDGYSDRMERKIHENPNLYCPIMRADVDYSGVVSILDLAAIAQQFGQTIPPANPRLNQNMFDNNTIDILDMAAAAGVFLKQVKECPNSAPPP